MTQDADREELVTAVRGHGSTGGAGRFNGCCILDNAENMTFPVTVQGLEKSGVIGGVSDPDAKHPRQSPRHSNWSASVTKRVLLQ